MEAPPAPTYVMPEIKVPAAVVNVNPNIEVKMPEPTDTEIVYDRNGKVTGTRQEKRNEA